jgi:hypothetical protein
VLAVSILVGGLRGPDAYRGRADPPRAKCFIQSSGESSGVSKRPRARQTRRRPLILRGNSRTKCSARRYGFLLIGRSVRDDKVRTVRRRLRRINTLRTPQLSRCHRPIPVPKVSWPRLKLESGDLLCSRPDSLSPRYCGRGVRCRFDPCDRSTPARIFPSRSWFRSFCISDFLFRYGLTRPGRRSLRVCGSSRRAKGDGQVGSCRPAK